MKATVLHLGMKCGLVHCVASEPR